MEAKINRFIDQLSKRNDPKLNEFFLEIVKDLEKHLKKNADILSERGMMELQVGKLSYENEKLYRMLAMFCGEKPCDISDSEIKELERFSHGKYYTAKSFFDTINKIRSVKSMMRFFYPKRTSFPNSIEELNKGDKFLNKKLWDLTRN